MLLTLLTRSIVPDLNLVLAVPLIFFSGLIAAVTAKCNQESLTSSLRVLSVPLMSAFAFLIA